MKSLVAGLSVLALLSGCSQPAKAPSAANSPGSEAPEGTPGVDLADPVDAREWANSSSFALSQGSGDCASLPGSPTTFAEAMRVGEQQGVESRVACELHGAEWHCMAHFAGAPELEGESTREVIHFEFAVSPESGAMLSLVCQVTGADSEEF